MDHTLKSIGLKSGEDGAHASFGQYALIFSLYHFWTILAVWELKGDFFIPNDFTQPSNNFIL